MHGSSDIPIDKYLARRHRETDLFFIDIDADAISKLNAELLTLNISKGTLFRDLDSLVEDIKQEFGVTAPVPKREVTTNKAKAPTRERVSSTSNSRHSPPNKKTRKKAPRIAKKAAKA